MEMALPVVNATAAALARVSVAFNTPYARAVVFGVHIDGNPVSLQCDDVLWFSV
jgi:serine palmitoyltransferase